MHCFILFDVMTCTLSEYTAGEHLGMLVIVIYEGLAPFSSKPLRYWIPTYDVVHTTYIAVHGRSV